MDSLLKAKGLANSWAAVNIYGGFLAWALFAQELNIGVRLPQGFPLLQLGKWFLFLTFGLGLVVPLACRNDGLGVGDGPRASPRVRRLGWAGILLIDLVAVAWAVFFTLAVNRLPTHVVMLGIGSMVFFGFGWAGAWIIRNRADEGRRPLLLGLGVAEIPLIPALFWVGQPSPVGWFIGMVLLVLPVSIPVMVVLDILMITAPGPTEFEVVGSKEEASGAPE